MENLRAFIIFGPYDLLFRVWLHPSITNPFRYKLAAALRTESTPDYFTVRRIFLKSYNFDSDSPPQQAALDDVILDAPTVRGLQDGQNEPLLIQLQEAGLVKVRPENSRETIRFFVAVHVTEPTDDILYYIAETITSEIRTHSTITMPAVYTGDGFCHILIKGEVYPDLYFNIGQLTRWISKHFMQHAVFTSTYLVDSPDHLIGRDDVIDDRTFIELRGRDPVVESIVPEVFTTLNNRSDDIFRFVAEHVKGVILAMEERRLLHDYLVGYLYDKPELSSVALMIYSAALESTLRHGIDPFIAKNCIDRQKLFDVAKVGSKESSKHLALGDLLVLCSHAVEMAGLPTKVSLSDSWQELAHLRNQPAHGEFNPSKWREHAQLLLDNFPRIRELTAAVGNH